jgi:hypothetical protein
LARSGGQRRTAAAHVMVTRVALNRTAGKNSLTLAGSGEHSIAASPFPRDAAVEMALLFPGRRFGAQATARLPARCETCGRNGSYRHGFIGPPMHRAQLAKPKSQSSPVAHAQDAARVQFGTCSMTGREAGQPCVAKAGSATAGGLIGCVASATAPPGGFGR